MRKTVISVCMALAMTASCVACAVAPEDETLEKNQGAESQQIELIQSDAKFTQEQQLARIKAEYLKENGGYKDSDAVVAIVTLQENAVIDDYLEKEDVSVTLRDYALGEGAAQAKRQQMLQNALISELTRNDLITGVENRFTTVMNGIAVSTQYGKLDDIKKIAGVKSVSLSDTFNRVKTAEREGASSIVNDVDVYDTGIFNSGSVSFTGKRTAVAVLDSGFDCSHSVFARQPEGELLVTQQSVSETLPRMNASTTTQGLEMTDVWYSRKIPYAYDYADKDDDVFPYDSEHGTHVAGIIGGKDDVITGVAIDTQLVLMKVFPDLDDGARTECILAALEDSVTLGVDAINMSLGSSCGFAREEDGNKINEVYDKLGESGVSLLTAASNSYSSAFGGEQGNTNKVTNPDSGTVGSPSTYAASLSVASISGVKSSYLVANGKDVIFFTESSSITGKPNDFVAELEAAGKLEDGSKEFEYVTIPGYGKQINYSGVDVHGKIALVKRGDNTFEDKALQAKLNGAVACIIYNNVEGDISMSMGKTDHIPCVSITKEKGTLLAAHDTGTLMVDVKSKAGPFMSDFSSWGPSPNLELKPEITAHGGTIKSSVPGGEYDELSGTSMATPNLCGVVVLIRQFLKEKYPDYAPQKIVKLCNQMLMSTATIVLNEEGNPYSPRKQGAGLASLYNVVNTKAYLSVDGKDRTKIELGDDPERNGVYEMEFNVVNVTGSELSYKLSVVGMTETVSSSDKEYVAEKGQLLGGKMQAVVTEGGTLSDDTVTVSANATAKVKVTYTLTDADKKLIDSLFPYGMYVEGFVKLQAVEESDIDLNIPFLAFYGDWTQAPMFDKTFYEVESEAHDGSIDDEDKLKADYFATTPYGSYFYNYIIPLGSYLYDMDDGYDPIPATEEHIAVSDQFAAIDGFAAIYGGLLRCAKTVTYTITDKVTGEVVKEFVDYNGNKAYSLGGTPIPYYEYINWRARDFDFVNNRSYEFKLAATLDYGEDGGKYTNVRNTFAFDFRFDNEAPVIKEATYEKVYDRTLKKDRYYINLTVYDNHYVQAITPVMFNSSSEYTTLTNHPIPVYSDMGKDNKVRIEITDFLDDIKSDALITSSLAFMVEDYALNSNLYLCQLPGTRGEFKFTRNGETDGSTLTILTIYEDEVVDLTAYLATSDQTVDSNKDYLKHLVWQSSNEKVALVEQGQVRGVSAGRSTISVLEQMNLRKASLLINVVKREETASQQTEGGRTATTLSANHQDDVSDAKLESLRFDYFETIAAFARAGQTSDIGSAGSRIFLSSLGSRVSMYPGESIKLHYDLQPWYAEGNYKGKLHYVSSDPNVATVSEDGVVNAMKKGAATITLRVDGSNIMARLTLTVNSEFIIENRMLVAYKGLGGVVEIPDDEGILYVGPYAFCLYEIDRTIDVPEDDLDANKIPQSNTTVTKVIIPEGVEEVQKYAFYNCYGLEEVVLPSSVKFIREFAFYQDEKLASINLDKVQAIGANAFNGCKALDNIDLAKTYSIGRNGFKGCLSLSAVDLTALRNTGEAAFEGCTSLANVTFTENTKLSRSMFARSGIKTVDLYERIEVPRFCFAQCTELTRVTLHNDVVTVGYGAFCESGKLASVTMKGVGNLGEQAFYACGALTEITLPDSEVDIGNYAFMDCNQLATVKLGANTVLNGITGSVFRGTAVSAFEVAAGNKDYKTGADGKFLLDASGETIVFAAIADLPENLTIGSAYKKVGASAFGGAKIKSLTIESAETEIGDYAFANCEELTVVNFPEGGVKRIGIHAFNGAVKLETADLSALKSVGDYAFANSGLKNAVLSDNAEFGEGAFFQSKLVTVTVGANSSFGLGAFQNCKALTEVTMPGAGGVHFGEACFSGDSALVTLDFTKVDGSIEREAFYGCTSLKGFDTKINLAEVTEVGDYAFADCGAIEAVLLPKIVKLGEGAFARYAQTGGSAPAIQTIILPETLKEMGDGVFLGCEQLTSVTLPASLEKIGDYLFAYCVNLQSAVLPDNLTKVGGYWFYGCESLSAVNLGNVEFIGDYAFTSAESLQNVDISSLKEVGFGAFASSAVTGKLTANNLVKAGDYAFQGANLLGFEANALQEIGIAAFQNNRNLSEFVFADVLKSVGITAFNGCNNLTSFYTTKDGGKTADGEIGNNARVEDGLLYTKLPNGKWQLHSVPAGMNEQTLTVAEGTVAIAFYAGNANTNVTAIVLPDSLKLIGGYAFYGYKKLKSVQFNSFTAPAMETTYEKDATLSPTDPGYDLLHNQFGLFGNELHYFNFIDMLGKKKPVTMILPANEDIVGYDSIVYQGYFGKVEDAIRSDYVAKDANLSAFLNYAEEIAKIERVTLADEKLINNAIVALNAIKQDATEYGYTQEEWQAMVDTVTSAKKTLDDLKGEVSVTPEPPAHEHTYSSEWTITETEHYHASTCGHADEKKDAGAHDTNGKDGSCSVCGYKAPSGEEPAKTGCGCNSSIGIAGSVGIAVTVAIIFTVGVIVALSKRKGGDKE